LVLAAAALGSILVCPPPAHAYLKDWIATIGSDPAAIMFVAGVVLLIVVLVGGVVAARAQRRRERQREAERQMAPAGAREVAIGPWVEEGRRLLNHWQERIERLDELQSRLAAMAQEIGQLKTQVSRMEAVQAENVRLGREKEALLLEREQVRSVLARIGELIQQASEARSRAAGDGPGAGP
jgi:predicted RNase H-like nuclease (RuvC/YqgF family)